MLNHLSNMACGQLLVPGATAILCLLISATGFGIASYWNQLGVLLSGFFLSLILTALGMLIPSALAMSATYTYSLQFSKNMRERIHALDNKDIKALHLREVRSCQVIRCQVGNLYHMESRAKLRMVVSAVNGFRFLLIQRNFGIHI
jgi:hypothetical protein